MTRETQKKKQALTEFIDNASMLRAHFVIDSLRRSLPPEWDEVDLKAKIDPKKTKITLRLDEDIIKFFRAQGPGYAKQINYVLRTFVTGRIANALFVREQSLDMEEIIGGYRSKPVEEVMEWAEQLTKFGEG